MYILPFAILIGFGTGGLFSLPQSMVADTLDLEELETGISPAGIYYGALTLFYKLSQAIAIFILGMVLDWVNFNPEVVVQEESTVDYSRFDFISRELNQLSACTACL